MRSVLKYAGIGLGVAVLVLLVWGFLVEPRLIDTEEYVVNVPGLPPGWEGARVAVVADWQVGMWGANTGTMRRITERMVEARPAAVLLAGDFIYKAGPDPQAEIAEAVAIVAPLARAGIPTFAVLGNHDYGMNHRDDPPDREQAARLAAALEAAGIRVLENAAVPLTAPAGGTLYVVGVGAEWPGNADPPRALRGVPEGAARVAVMHNPNSFPRFPAGSAPLSAAGHTHGGQVVLPGLPGWSWMQIVEEDELHADGWVEADYGQPGNRLYVNRGIGFSAVPARVNAPPELTYFVLRAGHAAPR